MLKRYGAAICETRRSMSASAQPSGSKATASTGTSNVRRQAARRHILDVAQGGAVGVGGATDDQEVRVQFQ